jgi:hypothetical protein
MTGLENPALLALQKASKTVRLWPPDIALEICNFLIPRFLAEPDVKNHFTGQHRFERYAYKWFTSEQGTVVRDGPSRQKAGKRTKRDRSKLCIGLAKTAG